MLTKVELKQIYDKVGFAYRSGEIKTKQEGKKLYQELVNQYQKNSWKKKYDPNLRSELSKQNKRVIDLFLNMHSWDQLDYQMAKEYVIEENRWRYED